MKKRNLLATALLALCLSSQISSAEETGSFDVDISFKGTSRMLSCYVPENYDAQTEYNLVISLHGSGDNSKNLRDVLFNQAGWKDLQTNTIYVFPDGGDDQARDFYSPAGDEAVIDSAVAWARDNYNIAPGKVILHGFSLGGRSALKYGLDFPEKIKGLVLNTPALQSPKDVQNIPGFSLIFNYENADKFPISISHGTEDGGFYNSVKMVSDSLVEHKAKLFYMLVPNMEHTIPPIAGSRFLFEYITTPITDPSPVLYKISAPLISADGKVTPVVRMTNLGSTAVNSLTFDYKVNGTTNTYNWTGELTDAKYLDIELPELNLSENGRYNIDIFYSNANGETVTENWLFNSQTCSFNVVSPSIALPYTEDFEDVDLFQNHWIEQGSGNYLTWSQAEVGKDASIGLFMLNTLLAYENYGLIETLHSNSYDYSSAEKPALSFDIACQNTHYTTAVFSQDLYLTDTLEILMTKDNGNTYTSIFKKWGDDLRTYTEELVDPLDMNLYFVEPTADEWKTWDLDLSSYQPNANTRFKFNCISGSGSFMILDNIKFYDKAAVSVADERVTELNVYPNPVMIAQPLVINFNSKKSGNVTISLYNENGEKSATLYNGMIAEGTNTLAVNIPNLAKGAFIIQAEMNGTLFNDKIIIK